MSSPSTAAVLDALADEFLGLHREKERLFWETKMGISQDHEGFHRAEVALRRFVGDPERLRELRALRARNPLDGKSAEILDCWIEMLRRNVVEVESARRMQRELAAFEIEIERRRGEMELGYRDPVSGQRRRASSVMLANLIRADEREETRHAAWEALRSIEDFVLGAGFVRLVRWRNALARQLGYADFYEYRVQQDEGFDKATLFGMLDDLEQRTAQPARRELERLSDGAVDGRRPWNYAYATSGSLAAERDPYFRFDDALERWGRSFAALGVHYRDASVTLDLIDRPGKYENGFMHGPTPAFFRRGRWLPAEINFTANAVPDQIGAGHSAMTTLFHEGGHAAHFANILKDAPCFSQEFAPTSTAFAETQSMFMDSLLSDADWQLRYARDGGGRPIPFDLIRRSIELQQPSRAAAVRRLMVVSYVEKAIYELSDEEINEDRIRGICREVERRLLFFEEGAPRPTLSIPHIISGDASCSYHGYVLASLAVEQTRQHFLERYGHIVDNPRVGEDLAQEYWAPGNMVSFLEYVQRLTGRPLSAEALARRVSLAPDEAVAEAERAAERLQSVPAFTGDVELDMRLRVVHGSAIVVDPSMDFARAAATFRAWVRSAAWRSETPGDGGAAGGGKSIEPSGSRS